MKGNSTSEGTTGSPGWGDVVQQPRPRPLPPETIDSTLKEQADLCKASIDYAQKLGKRLELALEHDDGKLYEEGNLSESVRIYEQMSRATVNFTRALNDLARLRSFMDGGPDSRPDLTRKGEQDLVQMVLAAATALGWKLVNGSGAPILPTVVPVRSTPTPIEVFICDS